MHRIIYTALLLLICSQIGCATHPQTAEEFREAITTGNYQAKAESFEVNRPFSEVVDSFEKMAPNCLNKIVRTPVRGYYVPVVTRYKAIVLQYMVKAELHVQKVRQQGELPPIKGSPESYYLMVADAAPMPDGKTRIDMYHPDAGSKPMVNAIKSWANGKYVGCPALTG